MLVLSHSSSANRSAELLQVALKQAKAMTNQTLFCGNVHFEMCPLRKMEVEWWSTFWKWFFGTIWFWIGNLFTGRCVGRPDTGCWLHGETWTSVEAGNGVPADMEDTRNSFGIDSHHRFSLCSTWSKSLLNSARGWETTKYDKLNILFRKSGSWEAASRSARWNRHHIVLRTNSLMLLCSLSSTGLSPGGIDLCHRSRWAVSWSPGEGSGPGE